MYFLQPSPPPLLSVQCDKENDFIPTAVDQSFDGSRGEYQRGEEGEMLIGN
jgi:hypothetical protein